jgi:hypothetical protein
MGTRSLDKTKISPKKDTRYLHKTINFLQKKSAFLQLGKTWNLIPRCQENALLALEFSNFSGGGPDPRSELRARYRGLCPRCVCPFSEVASPFQKSWICPCSAILNNGMIIEIWNLTVSQNKCSGRHQNALLISFGETWRKFYAYFIEDMENKTRDVLWQNL